MRCLFCKAPTDSSKSVEHVIPEAFGSKKIILPKGIVCDKCNNYFSRKIEGPLLAHPSFRNIRAWHQVRTKRGNMPSVQGIIGGTDIKINMKLDEEGELKIQFEKDSDAKKYGTDFIPRLLEAGASALIFMLDVNHPKIEMSRFLAKMALEAVAFRFLASDKFEAQLIDHPHFDPIRNFARYGIGPREWPYSQRRIFPIDTNMRHPETNDWVQAGFGHDLFFTKMKEMYFVFILYGMEYVINLGGPSIAGFEDWLKTHNNFSPVIERLGISIRTEDKNGRKTFFLDGDFDPRKGVKFDVSHGYVSTS